jgi:hypothetical protein
MFSWNNKNNKIKTKCSLNDYTTDNKKILNIIPHKLTAKIVNTYLYKHKIITRILKV